MNNEPVAWMFEKDGAYMCIKHDNRVNYDGGIPLYTNPVKELTDEEILEIASPMFEDARYPSTALDFARAILRKAQENET
jgi:hypothetical protein